MSLIVCINSVAGSIFLCLEQYRTIHLQSLCVNTVYAILFNMFLCHFKQSLVMVMKLLVHLVS